MKLTKKLEAEILKLYNNYWDAYFNGNMRIMSSLTHEDIHVIGSAYGEVFKNKKETVKYYKATADQVAGKAEARNRNISVAPAGNNILVTEESDLYVLMNKSWTFYGQARISTFFCKTKNKWKIIQQHSSMPDARTGGVEQLNTDKIKEENLRLKDAIKRRTIELENKSRELEIEASLERIRAQAMGMTKPDDLLSICERMFKEFQTLGFTELRNAMINIHNDEQGTFVNYDFSEEIGKSINHLTYNIHPVIEKQIKQIRSANDAFSETVFIDEDLKSWKEFRKNVGEKDDPRISNSTALYYYFYSIGTGSIGISTFNAIGPEKLELLKRFRNVFNLSYQRYSDIALAEAQVREAQIELALERVRARAMAMQKSNELSDLVDTVFKELTKLDFALSWCIINIIDEPSLTNMVWAANPNIDEAPDSYHMKFEDYPFHHAMMKGYQEQRTKFIYVIEGLEKKVYDEYLFKDTEFRKVPKEAQAASRGMGKYVCSFTFSNFGGLQTVGEEPLSDINLDILERFGKVFDLTYTRFNDLLKAEAQTREAEIELALERVRARTMAMQKSDELKVVIQLVYEQFVNLNIHIEHTGFIVDYKANDNMHIWLADRHEIPSEVIIPYFDSPPNNSIKEAKEKGEDFFTYLLTFEEKNKFYQELFKFIPDVPEESLEYYFSCQGLAGSGVLLENIGLYIENFSGIPYSDEENKILMRFGKVFQQTYTRFLDLQKAEAQAREAQIEAALERVRSLALGMRKSEDVGNVTDQFFTQLTELSVDVKGCSIVVIDEDNDKMEFWRARSNIAVKPFDSTSFAESMDLLKKYMPDWFSKFTKALGKRKNYLIDELLGKRRSQFINLIAEQYKYSSDEKTQLLKNAPEKITAHYIFFKLGYLGLLGEKKLADENLSIARRFVEVFDFAYTRFLDIKKAEAQARESQIEAALERVRSRSMAMHKSDELVETSDVLFQELNKLGIVPIRTGIGIIDGSKNTIEVWSRSELSERVENKILGLVPMNIHPLYQGIIKAWKDNQPFYSHDLAGDELIDYYDKLSSFLSYPKRKKYNDKETIATFFFPEGSLNVISREPLKEEECGIVIRFAKVFGQVYRRFLDLKQAEAQAREAQIEAALERVRTNAMSMQTSDDLAKIVEIVFTELKKVGFDTIRCGIGIIESAETKKVDIWSTTLAEKDLSIQITGDEVLEGHALLDGIIEHWINQTEFSYVLEGEDFIKYYKTIEKTNFHLPDYTQNNLSINEKQYYYMVPCKAGGLYALSTVPFTDEVKKLMKRFIEVFQLAYTRFADLKKAEAQNKIIQAENERKTKELEDARQLQLSMLPRELPQVSNLDIAVYMKTATEVGGDYYDFHTQPDGTLNVLVGDATGHGMMSGMMVSIMKSFFIASRNNIELKHFFESSNISIKDMQLGRLMMACIGVQVTTKKLIATNAGMPSLIYFRNKSQKAGEFVINNMPLGAMKGSKYELKKINYEKGDTLLLMSDGFAELKNKNEEQYGYERVKKEFKSVVQKKSNEIIEHLKNSAIQWADGVEPDDDLTFVVIKVK